MSEKKYTSEEVLDLQSAAYQKGYNEGYRLGKNTTWVKATRENMRRSAILRDSVLAENHIHQWVVNGWDEKGVLFTNKIFKEWWELEILDESGTAAGREEDLRAEIDRRNKLLEDGLKLQCRLNMPGISEQEQERAWATFKLKNSL